MSIKERFIFRWKYFQSPCSWETLESHAAYLPDSKDVEKSIWKRRIRAVVFGYGPGWTLWQAIRHWLWGIMGVLAIVILISLLILNVNCFLQIVLKGLFNIDK